MSGPADPRAQSSQSRSLPSLELDSGINQIVFSDERARAPYQVPAGTFASVTLDGEGSTWGEFLTREQTLAVLGWLTALVASEAADA